MVSNNRRLVAGTLPVTACRATVPCLPRPALPPLSGRACRLCYLLLRLPRGVDVQRPLECVVQVDEFRDIASPSCSFATWAYWSNVPAEVWLKWVFGTFFCPIIHDLGLSPCKVDELAGGFDQQFAGGGDFGSVVV